MFSRFRIEDLISQDSGSVVYFGVDAKTGERAALRRFFLRSGGSTGIVEEDQAAFSEALVLLSEMRHPSLRRVLEGGLDEVDGVPYVATEWVEGVILREFLEDGFLSVADGECLVRQGLDVVEYVESFFGEGAHWLNIHPDSVISKVSEEGKRFTFSICLDRWMGIEHGEDGLHELATLVEEACGLGEAVAEGGGGVLGAWVRHVRETGPTVSAARGVLDQWIHEEANGPIAPPMSPSLPPSPPPAPPAPRPSEPEQDFMAAQGVTTLPSSGKHGLEILFAVVGVLLLLAGGGFLYIKTQRAKAESAVVAKVEVPAEAAVATEGQTPAPAAIADEEEAGEEEEKASAPAVEELAEEEVPAPGSVAERALQMREKLAALKARTEFQADEGALLSARKGDEVMIVGEVHHVRETKEWLVFEFTRTRGPDVLNVRLKKANAPALTLAEIEGHEGQKRRFRGIVGYYWARSYNRVFLEIESLEALSEE